MPTLLLRLDGPLQSWGSGSRFTSRDTRNCPTKSGIVGLLAAAEGIERTGDISYLASLKIGVRVDQPGRVVRDFQTERTEQGKSLPLTNRFYLADAKFVAAVEGEEADLQRIYNTLLTPKFPLYLGRRSCPPATRIPQKIVSEPLQVALREAEWIAADHVKRGYRNRKTGYSALIERDAVVGESATSFVRDLPITFNPEHRRYSLRPVVHEVLHFDEQIGSQIDAHDPLELVMRFE